MLKIAVCDDEPLLCGQIQEKVRRALEEPCQVLCFSNANQLARSVSEIDILLLDIQMPGISGIDFAKQLRRAGHPCALIFITILKEYVFDAFEVEAVDYLCKPIDDNRLKSALARAVKLVSGRQKRSLFIQSANRCRAVTLDSIRYCEVIDRKIYLHTQNGTVEYYGRMKDVEKQMDSRFVKCHRSYLVNLDHFSEYTDGRITLDNGDSVPVSRLRQQDFMKTMLQYLKKEGGRP